jgi:septal ring factor EnvC (AmiA/AmiB activator)
MKNLKNNLLKDIVVNMDISRDIIGKAKEKRLGKNKQYINELNEKIEAAMEELAELPYQIKLVNEELLAESIQVFYNQLETNKGDIKEVTDWIANIREELKKKILLKQDLETKNSLIYTYMHDILGAEIMELFDSEHGKK